MTGEPAELAALGDLLGRYRVGRLRRTRVGRRDEGGHGYDGCAESSDETCGDESESLARDSASEHGNRPRNDSDGLSTFNALSKLGGRTAQRKE